MPLANLATHLAAFACRVHDVGKTLHVLLTGCNTVNLVLPLHQKLSAIRPEALGSVWMLATSDVWPGILIDKVLPIEISGHSISKSIFEKVPAAHLSPNEVNLNYLKTSMQARPRCDMEQLT